MAIDPDSTRGIAVFHQARIAWIAPSLDRGWRWQPLLREFSAIWPNMVVFTRLWPGFTPGFEETIKIHRLRGFRNITIGKSDMGHPTRFKWASPLALWDLVRFRPEIILTNGFHLCTIYALLVKGLLRSRVVLLWQGISPENRGDKGSLRLKVRRAIGRFFDLAICNSQCGTKYLEDLVGLPAKKVHHFVGEVAAYEFFTWEGFVPYERLGAYYDACDVFILPSWEDTWGVVVLEAMVFGKPVLCSRFAGSSELVQHGISGYVFDPGKPQDLANYMTQFIHRPQLIARYGAASRKAMAHYTPGNAAAGLSRILCNTFLS